MHFANRGDSELTRLFGGSAPYVGVEKLAIPWRGPMQIPLNAFPEKIVLQRICPERNERRFYCLEITVDFFGNTLLSRNWGRIGTSGKQRLDLHQDFSAALLALIRLERSKRTRGYNSAIL
jgi:predicted DNA-binding WGR domain protein